MSDTTTESPSVPGLPEILASDVPILRCPNPKALAPSMHLYCII